MLTLSKIAEDSGLSVEQIKEIRNITERDEYSIKQLSKDYNISFAMVRWIIRALNSIKGRAS